MGLAVHGHYADLIRGGPSGINGHSLGCRGVGRAGLSGLVRYPIQETPLGRWGREAEETDRVKPFSPLPPIAGSIPPVLIHGAQPERGTSAGLREVVQVRG